MPERIPRERRILRPHERASAGRYSEAGAMPIELDSVWQLLHRRAEALGSGLL